MDLPAEETPKNITDSWDWVRAIFDEAHLPHLGLPVRWDKTQKQHTKIAYDTLRKREFNVETGIEKKSRTSPVQFIKSTKDQTPMPGTNQPAAVRYEHYYEGKLNDLLIKGASNELLYPCFAHGDYVKVEALQADHLDAKSKILERQEALIKKMNDEPKFAEFVMGLEGMDKFFVKIQMCEDKEEKYYGTLFFYELYFNDIDNIWLICNACNLQKSDNETLKWLEEQWLYGKEFFDYLSEQESSGVLIKKIGDKEGLAEVIMDWFWKRHGNYFSTCKTFLKDVDVPIKILGKEVDHQIGGGKLNQAKRLQATLDFRIGLMGAIATVPALEMHGHFSGQLQPEQIEKVGEQIILQIPNILETEIEKAAAPIVQDNKRKKDDEDIGSSKRQKK